LTEKVSEMDQRDIAASLNGDGEAYARLVRHYQDQVAAQMWRFTRHPAVLEELVQEVFVEAYLCRRYREWTQKGYFGAGCGREENRLLP
jgi:DNA-directed RNA polymerase specialized sigma24 family protein